MASLWQVQKETPSLLREKSETTERNPVNTEEFKKLISKVQWDRINVGQSEFKVGNERKVTITVTEGDIVLSFERYMTWARDLGEYCRNNNIIWANRHKFGFNPVEIGDYFWQGLRKITARPGTPFVTSMNNGILKVLQVEELGEGCKTYHLDPMPNWENVFKSFCEDYHFIWKNQKDWVPVRFDTDILPGQYIYGGDKCEIFCRRLNQMVENHFRIQNFCQLTSDMEEVTRKAQQNPDGGEEDLQNYVRGFLYGWDAHE
jgi:hypothetical protein